MSVKGIKAKRMVGPLVRGSAPPTRRKRQLRTELGYPKFLIRLVGVQRLMAMAADTPIEHRCD